MDAFKLMRELRLNCEQEVHYLPKKTGLSLIESSVQVGTDPPTNLLTPGEVIEGRDCKRPPSALQDESRISAKCRDAKVEDLWSLTSFFGYSTQTFVLAVNLLDRFLAMMRVQEHTHTHKPFSCRVMSLDRDFILQPSAHRSNPSTCPASASAASTWRPK